MDRMVAAGSTACPSIRTLAEQCEIILTCLPTSDHARTVLFSEGGLSETAKPGTLVIDQTTGDPIASRAMAVDLAKRGIELIDAPVAGGLEAANAGTIAILVGATEAQYTRALPILRDISAKIVHTGGQGTGYVAKLANNLVYATQRMINIEAVAPAVKNGIELPLLLGNLVKEYHQMCINEMGRDAQANSAALVVDRLAGTQVVPADYSVS
jgi:3-hydroxyisobutyrate dehydrogenase